MLVQCDSRLMLDNSTAAPKLGGASQVTSAWVAIR